MESEKQYCAGSDPNSITFCPINLTWTSWTSWSSCSATCGEDAVIKRSRTCINGQFGGSQCHETYENEIANCNLEVRNHSIKCFVIQFSSLCISLSVLWQECRKDCQVDEWSEWSTCSATCTNYESDSRPKRSRQKTVLQHPNSKGSPCPPLIEEATCSTKSCPVHGNWNSWGSWSICSTTCGQGLKTRHRTCSQPQNGGDPCNGDGDAYFFFKSAINQKFSFH